MKNLPGPEEVIGILVTRREDTPHGARRPIDEPLLAFHDDIVGLPRAFEQKNGIAQLGIHHIMSFGPSMTWAPLSRFRINGFVGI